tara:strand:+ start:14188 stop:14550 length:363 start_codon:yes stop_codon:yes gene_type:complete
MNNNAAQEEKRDDVVKGCYEDGSAEINGRSYKFCKVNHKKRLKIFGYASKISKLLNEGNLSFLGSDEQLAIEDLIFSNMTYNDSSLAKIDNHFEKYGEDYIPLFTMSLSVFSYPFMKGSH